MYMKFAGRMRPVGRRLESPDVYPCNHENDVTYITVVAS